MRSRSRRSVPTGMPGISSTSSPSWCINVGASVLLVLHRSCHCRTSTGARAYMSFREGTAAVCGRDARLQELGDALVGVNLVLDPGETVALIFVHFIFRHSPALLDGIRHLLGFLLGAARIVAAGQQQQRRFDVVDKENRRTIVEQGFA